MSFAGTLSTEVPAGEQPREVTQSGFALMRSRVPVPTLFGEEYHDLSAFDGLEIELRGDGGSRPAL